MGKKIINKSHFAGGGRNLCPSLPGTVLSTHVKAGCSLPAHSCLPTPKWNDGKKNFLVSNLKKWMVATRDETNLGGIWMLFDRTRGKVLCLLPHWSQRQLSHWGFPEISAARPRNKPSTRVKENYGEKQHSVTPQMVLFCIWWHRDL